MKEISIRCRRGDAIAFVDDIDYGAVAEKSWSLQVTRAGIRYAVNRSLGSLHGVIARRMGMRQAEFIDHRDRDGLNNRRSNLRPADRCQNGWNQLRPLGISKFPGVHRNRSAWAVRFDHQGAPVYFGTHRDLEVAKCIAAEHLLRLRGEFLTTEVRRLCEEQLGGAAA